MRIEKKQDKKSLAFFDSNDYNQYENHFQIERGVFMTYNTKQKDLILSIIRNKKSEFTIKDLYDELDKKIGLTTIYRLVDKLVLENRMNKYIGKDNITYYQYLEECDCCNHYYLKCDDCGAMIHVDCDHIEELTNHITIHHGFVPNKERIIIHGLCEDCFNRKGGLTC